MLNSFEIGPSWRGVLAFLNSANGAYQEQMRGGQAIHGVWDRFLRAGQCPCPTGSRSVRADEASPPRCLIIDDITKEDDRLSCHREVLCGASYESGRSDGRSQATPPRTQLRQIRVVSVTRIFMLCFLRHCLTSLSLLECSW